MWGVLKDYWLQEYLNVLYWPHLRLVILRTLLSKATYNWGIHKAINLEEANRQRKCPLTPSLRHCSNKYKLAREGEKDKEKDEDIEKGKVFFFLWWSQVVLKEMSFQLLLEDWQGSSIPDGGGKIIPPARNGERKCSGEWFWASLWWYHEATLTSRYQTSGGDVDS